MLQQVAVKNEVNVKLKIVKKKKKKKERKKVSDSVMFDSLEPHGLKPARLICPWNSPGKNTEVGNHSLPQGIFPI